MATRTIEFDEFLDHLPFSAFHIRALALGIAIMLVDGYEVGLLGLVLPKVAQSFGTEPSALTWVLSAQQVGMVLGAYFIAPLADRFGRKPLVLMGLLAVGLCSLVTIVTGSLATLAACRLLTGIFASTLIANIVSWTSEIAPARSRTMMVTSVLTGSTAGAVLGALVQAFVLERFGWRGAFWIGSILPILLVPISWRWFPESPRFLAARRPDDPRLAFFRQLGGTAAAGLTFVQRSTDSGGRSGSVAGLFQSRLGLVTILIWWAFLLDFLFISAWFWKTTVFYEMLHLTWGEIAITTAIDVVFGAIGMLTVGLVTSRFAFRHVIPAYFFCVALCLVTLGMIAPHGAMYVALAALAVFQNAGHAGLALIASTVYPASCRATGVGWAYGAGRIASIFGPPLGAMAMQYGSAATFFFMLAMPPLVTCLIVIILFRAHRARDCDILPCVATEA